MMHENSLQAYEAKKATLSKRAKDVLAIYRKHYPTPLSDRFIMQALGAVDMNFCRPRCTELLKAGLIEESGKMKDEVTGMNVRHCRLKQDEGKQMEMFAKPQL